MPPRVTRDTESSVPVGGGMPKAVSRGVMGTHQGLCPVRWGTPRALSPWEGDAKGCAVAGAWGMPRTVSL